MSQSSDPRFHVVVVLQQGDQWVPACLAAACAQSLAPRQVTLVDNLGAGEPDDPTARELAERHPQVQVFRPSERLSLAGCYNRAAAKTRDSDYVILLSSDTILALNALEKLAEAWAGHPNTAVMGGKVLGGDVETIQHLGSDMRGNGLPRHYGAGQRDTGQFQGVRPALSIQPAALAVRNEVWCELGGLDESYWPAYFEVADLCFRARRAGWGVAVACEATVTFFGRSIPEELDGAERGEFFRNRARFLRRHYQGGDWLRRFLPDELRWLLSGQSGGMRAAALSALIGGLFSRRNGGPQTVQEH